MVPSIDDLQERKAQRDKPFPKMGPCAATTRLKRQRLRRQKSPAGLSPLPGTENREGRSFRSSSGARWACWHCLGAQAWWCPQVLLVAVAGCACVRSGLLLAASSCCSLDSAALGAWATASMPGGRKSTSPAPWNGGLALASSELGTNVVTFTLKQFWIAKCSLS